MIDRFEGISRSFLSFPRSATSRCLRSIIQLCFLLVLSVVSINGAHAQQNRLLFPGSAVVTGFSGTFEPVPIDALPPEKFAIDETFIDPEGASARIFLPSNPGFAWDGRQWDLRPYFEVKARDVGQVFGIAIDAGWPISPNRADAYPNVYLTATSAFGLHIITPDIDGNGFPDRILNGQPDAVFMQGQFGGLLGQGNMIGQKGGPGSIYKIDGRTREVSLFSNITLFDQQNSGAALGNIAFDPVHNQLFVSDRDTGLIHRIDLEGNDLEQFDHGQFGRINDGLPPVAFDAANRLDIKSFQFDPQDPTTWAYAQPERRVWGLAVHQGRLYYSVAEGPQIWSVGIDLTTGAFSYDARWELDVSPQAPADEVSDIVFNAQGAMIIAQRGRQVASYNYSENIEPKRARVYRYKRESPDNLQTISVWQQIPEEYAIGFRPAHRNSTGGVDLSYGYTDLGYIDKGNCEGTLWATGESLRVNAQLSTSLAVGGQADVQGLQGAPADLVRQGNVPPWSSYMIDYDGRFDSGLVTGQIGDVENYAPCLGRPVDIIFNKSAGLTNFDISTGAWTLGYIIDILNAGDPFAPQSFIEIGDLPPEGAAISGVSGDNWQCNTSKFPIVAPNSLKCSYNFGDGLFATGAQLPPLKVDLTTNLPGRYKNCAYARLAAQSGLFDRTPDNNQSCVENDTNIDIGLEKKATKVRPSENVGPVDSGGNWLVDFTLEVSNHGASIPAGTTISITDPVPSGMQFIGATGPGWDCPDPPNTFPISPPDALNCTFTPTSDVLEGQIIGTLQIAGLTESTGRFSNCALTGLENDQGTQETNYDNNKSCVTVKIDEPQNPADIGLEKSVVKLIEEPAPDGSIAYEFTLAATNHGPAFNGQNALEVSDIVPAGLIFTDATYDPAIWSCTPAVPPNLTSGNSFSCTYIGSGQVATGAALDPIKIKVRVPAGSGQYQNCASVDFSQSSGLHDSDTTNNAACTDIKVVAPPIIEPECGVNVIFVVDVSASIPQSGAASSVNSALNNAKHWFDNTNASGVPAQGAVIVFSDTATLAQPMSAATFSTYLPLNYGGETNWEAAMQMAASEAATAPAPTIIIFITDGIPNKYIDDISGNVISTSDPVLATNQALPHVSTIYGLGVPIYGYGVGSVQTHLNALLGTSTTSVGFGGLRPALETLGKQTCSDLYLRKTISPRVFNYFNNPGPKQTTVTLTLQNTSSAISNVTVEDVLPPELVNPTNFNASGTATASQGPPGTVVWNITNFAANSTRTVSFDVDVQPDPNVPLGCNYTIVRNLAQVTATSDPIHSTPNSFADPMTGPVVEHDESQAYVLLKDCEGSPGSPKLLVSKTSIEGCMPVGQGSATGVVQNACTFTVTVRASGNFSGPVTFGDSVFNDPPGAPTTVGQVAISNVTPPPAPSTQGPYCFEGFTSLQSACSQNLVLNTNQSISFDVTLGAPPDLALGNYLNCFVVKSGPSTSVQNLNFSPYYGTANQSQWWNWGYCSKFSVSEPSFKKAGKGQPDLQIEKIPPASCEAGRKCMFTVKVTNVGDAQFTGPIFVSDATQTKGVKLARGGSGGGWACSQKGNAIADCFNPSVSLEPGQSSSFKLPLRLPSILRKNSLFENCATLTDGLDLGTRQPVLFAQIMLNALGYKPGPADGIMGRNTRIALQAFRKDNNLPPNRSVGVDLARLFKAGASVDKKTDNNQSCASVMVTKHVRATPPVKSLPKSKPNKPRATTPKCEFPSIFSPTIGRCINVLKLLPKRGDNGLILRK